MSSYKIKARVCGQSREVRCELLRDKGADLWPIQGVRCELLRDKGAGLWPIQGVRCELLQDNGGYVANPGERVEI